ncbi:MAG: hypothetical protein AB8G86_23615 [Saprospiraceae bacterium]
MKIAALLLAFYMLIGSFIPRTDFSQLVYLGELKEHYQEHKAEAELQNLSITLFEFLYQHFIDSNQHADVDHEEDHHQLPLQTMNGFVDLMIPTSFLLDFEWSTTIFLPTISYQSPFYLSGFLSNMVHPPAFS